MRTWANLTPKELRAEYRRTLKFIEDARRRGGEMEDSYISAATGALKGMLEVAPAEMQSDIKASIAAFDQ